MTPSNSINHTANTPTGYTHVPSDSILRNSALVEFADSFYFFSINDGSRVSFSVALSSFSGRIKAIIKVCSQKQMTRVAARRVVAFVKNVHSFWNRTFSEYPSNPRCNLAFCEPRLENSISVFGAKSGKRPTLIVGIDLNPIPKSFRFLGPFVIPITPFGAVKSVPRFYHPSGSFHRSIAEVAGCLHNDRSVCVNSA